ncbi:MAG TPA: DUF2461 family protein [Caldithrix sp.]|nr:DUF2461 family protein [Caldithrix sp.]
MSETARFRGFTPETIRFFDELRKNNSKDWFEQNRPVFGKRVLTPAQAFVSEMGKRLEKIATDVVAIPKIDKTIFRLGN